MRLLQGHMSAANNEVLLEISDLETHFPFGGRWVGRRRWVRAVDGVNLDVKRGEVLGLVGESGSGKTTLGRSVLRLIEPTGGSVRFDGIDVLGLAGREMRRLRKRGRGSALVVLLMLVAVPASPFALWRIPDGEPVTVEGQIHYKVLDRAPDPLEALSPDPCPFSGRQVIPLVGQVHWRPIRRLPDPGLTRKEHRLDDDDAADVVGGRVALEPDTGTDLR